MSFRDRYIKKDSRGSEDLKVGATIRDVLLGLVALVVIFNFVFGSWFTIDQTEMGNVRRFGTKVYTQPLSPGLHFKIPFIDTVDTIRVTLNTIHIEPFPVSTVDNQVVTITENYNYTIPVSQVNHMLYEVGGAGSTDIHDQAIAVAKDRTAAVFAGQNMVTVNANRAVIQEQISAAVHQRLQQLFGIEPHSLQIPGIVPSPAFLASNEAAVKAKNAAVAAENTKRTIQFEADQQVIKATGDANSVKAKADGNAYSVRVSADAEQYRQIAEAKGTVARISAFGSAALYNDWIRAQAWKGEVPTYMGSGQPIPFLNMGGAK